MHIKSIGYIQQNFKNTSGNLTFMKISYHDFMNFKIYILLYLLYIVIYCSIDTIWSLYKLQLVQVQNLDML